MVPENADEGDERQTSGFDAINLLV